ncbi:MAG TPA: META domain-containing protein [Sphingomicrobium sp.]|jgi:heat shock protein HslJ|nr:META domain-containing protein [Sphingomicrobium sp.]
MRPLALAALLAACAPVPASPPGPTPTLSLIGEWRVVAVNGHAVAGSARIVPPIMSFSFGCNSGRSGFRIEGSVLTPVGPMGTTEMACVSADDSPSTIMQREDEGFRIAFRPMRATFYGENRVRLANEAGTIDLAR